MEIVKTYRVSYGWALTAHPIPIARMVKEQVEQCFVYTVQHSLHKHLDKNSPVETCTSVLAKVEIWLVAYMPVALLQVNNFSDAHGTFSLICTVETVHPNTIAVNFGEYMYYMAIQNLVYKFIWPHCQHWNTTDITSNMCSNYQKWPSILSKAHNPNPIKCF